MKGKVKSISLFLAFIMLFNMLVPTLQVLAAQPENVHQYGTLQFDGALGFVAEANGNNEVSLRYDNGNFVVITGEGLYSDSAQDTQGTHYFVYALGNVTIQTQAAEEYVAYIQNGNNREEVTADIEKTIVANSVENVLISFDHPEQQGNPQQPDDPVPTFQVEFDEARWQVGNVEVTASVEGKDITHGAVELNYEESITLSGFDSNKMEAKVVSMIQNDDFEMPLNVRDNVETKLANQKHEGGIPNTVRFCVVPKEGHDSIENGTLEIETRDGLANANFENNQIVISYQGEHEGYVLTVIPADVQFRAGLNGNGNVELNVKNDTGIVFLLQTPQNMETPFIPNIHIGDRVEQFTNQNGYVFTTNLNFDDYTNRPMSFWLDFNQDPHGDEIWEGILEVQLDQGDTANGNVITYANGYVLTITPQGEYTTRQNEQNHSYEFSIANGTDVTFTITPPQGVTLQKEASQSGDGTVVFKSPMIRLNEVREWFRTNYQYTGNISFSNERPVVNFELNFGDDGVPAINGNTYALVRVSGGEGSYIENYYDHETGEEQEKEVPYAKSYVNALIDINGEPVEMPESENNQAGVPATTETGIKYFYDTEENTGKVAISFATLFNQQYVGTITINGKTYHVANYIDYTNRTNWLNHYSHQCTSFNIEIDKPTGEYLIDSMEYEGDIYENVEIYDIEVNIAPLEGRYQWIGNFLWTADPAQENNDNYIAHSKLRLVSATYEMDGKQITETAAGTNNFENSKYIEYDVGPDRENPNYEAGSLVVPEGATVIMKIIPDYGYQVTSFGINDNEVITGDDISEFEFFIHKGNFHLGAKVTKVEDLVNAKSEKVNSGNIEIGSNEIDSGSVVLTVNDINPDETKIVDFENAAGDYTINSYLDIDLDQVWYKGTADNVWSTRIHELNNEATITLQLEEGIDGNDIIIVHNVNDGDEYEIIDIESYDSETNTITFKTKSFSNYAIAVKEEMATTEITENDVTLAKVSANYTGTAIRPAITVTVNEKTLTKNVDYKVKFENNTEVGTATVTITGMGDYAGEVTKTFTIKPIVLTANDVTLAKVNALYTGSSIRPGVTVAANGKTLTKNIDYKVKFENNIDVGTAEVIIIGIGNYKGSVTKTFTIKLNAPKTGTLSAYSKAFTARWTITDTIITGIQVQYSTDSNFSNATIKRVSNPLTKNNLKITGLKGNTTYYVRVREVKLVDGKTYYSAWTTTQKVVTKK